MQSRNTLGSPFIELHKVESTNNYAMGLVHASMAQHGTAVFAHDQFGGKGQRNRLWRSEPGKNIAVSIVIEPKELATSQFFLLSMAAALASRKLFASYAGAETKIKWPNDIYWRDRKAGGILIENIVQGSEWKFAVVGIGLNINQVSFGSLQRLAVSLKQITGKEYPPVELAKQLCTFLDQYLNQLKMLPQQVIEEYRSHLYKLDEKVKLKKGSRVFEAFIRDVKTDGRLVVQHAVEERFEVGEVEWMAVRNRQ